MKNKTLMTLFFILFMLSGCQYEQQKTSITIEMSMGDSNMGNTYQNQLRTIPNLITLHNNVTNKTYYISSLCPISQKYALYLRM